MTGAVIFDDADLQDAIDRADLPAADAAVLGVAIDEGVFEDYLFVPAPRGRRAYLFAPHGGRLHMLELAPPGVTGPRRAAMCSICLSVLPGRDVALWTNLPTGRDCSVVGDWVCRGFECKDRIEGRITTRGTLQLGETVPLEWRRRRMRERLDRLVGRWLAVS